MAGAVGGRRRGKAGLPDVSVLSVLTLCGLRILRQKSGCMGTVGMEWGSNPASSWLFPCSSLVFRRRIFVFMEMTGMKRAGLCLWLVFLSLPFFGLWAKEEEMEKKIGRAHV